MAFINFQPKDYFNTKLYTGNGSTQSISSVGFQPDWLWIKNRDGANNHILQDAVRGATKSLESDGAGAEVTSSTRVTSFDSDGFSIGSAGTNNTNTNNYVSWNWKANGAGVSNTDGSITSTVSANTTSGFSIVKWNADNQNPSTIGHGLGVAPSVIIMKETGGTSNWVVGGFGLDWSGYLLLNTTNAFTNDDNDTSGTGRMFSQGGNEPTSTIWYTNSGAIASQNGTAMIAICIAQKSGYSSMGSYIGNGSATDAPFIYTGFKPAFILIKSVTTTNWNIFDNKRSAFNVADETLWANSTDSEATVGTSYGIDILSNGFKPRSVSSQVNFNGTQMLYMAFAESPIVSSNGVAATAR